MQNEPFHILCPHNERMGHLNNQVNYTMDKNPLPPHTHTCMHTQTKNIGHK